MSNASSRVTSQGQISVPASIRERFHIVPGTVLEWFESNGEICVRPKRLTLDEVNERLRPFVKREQTSLSELRDAKAKYARDKAGRGRR